MHALQAHEILKFRPVPIDLCVSWNPQATVHGIEDSCSLRAIGRRIFSNQLSNAANEQIAAVVIGRSMRHGPTVVVEGIAGPDAAITIVEMVAIGIPVALLPFKVQLQCWPELTHECRIGIILEMPEQFIDIVEVHIIVAHLSVIIRQLADVAVAIHRSAPLLSRTSQILGCILGRMRIDGFDVAHHAP